VDSTFVRARSTTAHANLPVRGYQVGESAFDVLCYITNIPSFLRSLSNDKSPTVIDRLRQLLSNNATLQTIHLKLSFLHDVFEPMVRLLLKYQAHAVYAHKVFGDVDDFRVALSPLSDSDFDTLPSVSKFAASQPEKAGWLLAKHPSWNFFKAARIFNPYHVKRRGIPEPLEKYLTDNIPFAPEDLTHLNGIACEAKQFARWSRNTRDLDDPEEDFDISSFWKDKGKQYPMLRVLALRVLSVPVSSADAERSFSAYNYIVDHRRTGLTNDSVRAHVLLATNKNL
jgi:hypothetical protein